MKRRDVLSLIAVSTAALVWPKAALAGTWADWTKLIMTVPRVVGAGIYTQSGLVCSQTGISFGKPELAEIVKAFKSSYIDIGGVQYRRMTGNDEMVLLRGGDTPLVINKTAHLYLVAKGEPESSAPEIAGGMRWIFDKLRDH